MSPLIKKKKKLLAPVDDEEEVSIHFGNQEKSFEGMIEEYPDQCVSMYSDAYFNLPVVDQARLYLLKKGHNQQNGYSKQQVNFNEHELKSKLKSTLRSCYRKQLKDEKNRKLARY